MVSGFAALALLISSVSAEEPIAFTGVRALAPGAQVLTVEAPRTSWFMGEHRVVFEGGVVAVRGSVTIRSEQLVVHYDADGTFSRAEAEGDVVASRDRWTARGDRGVLDVALGVLVLEGSPIVEDGINTLQGERITMALDADRVDCDRCTLVVRE